MSRTRRVLGLLDLQTRANHFFLVFPALERR